MDKQIAERRVMDRFHAFVEMVPSASLAESSGPGAPLAGTTVAVKDNIAVQGLPFTAGHPLFDARRAARDAQAVVRLREAGARIIGVTRTDAGGFGVTTPEVQNPVAPNLIVGGSSGGSAAAVAAGLADLGLGTDTGGSCRIPAACSGIFGYKPSFGEVPLDGVWPMAPTMDHVGVMARSLDLIERAVSALMQQSLQRAAAAPVAGFDPKVLGMCDASVRAAFRHGLEQLREAGVDVREVDLPELNAVTKVHGTLVLAQARAVYAADWPQHASRLGQAAVYALRAAESLDATTIERAQRQADTIRARVARVFERVDVLLAPTLAIRPPQRGLHRVCVNGVEAPVVRLLVQQTCLANLCGIPALAAPFLVSQEQTPHQSLQLMAAAGRDDVLLDCARRLAPIFVES